MKVLVYVGMTIIILVILWFTLHGFIDCWSTSPAGSFWGKMYDCGG
jgi:hypothetical protein